MEWSIDLPNWHSQPDPEVAGATVWVHTDYDGEPDMALTVVGEDDNRVSVVWNPMILPAEIDGCELGIFGDWDAALDFALGELEMN